MQEIKEAIVAGTAPSEIAVVLPDSSHIHWWTRMWQDLMGTSVRPPEIMVYTNAGFRLRSARLKKLYIEDINEYEEGIYDPRIIEILPVAEEVVFTSSWILLNLESHTDERSRAKAQVRSSQGLESELDERH